MTEGLTRYVFINPPAFLYPGDVARIVKVMADYGIEVSPTHAEQAWGAYSDDRAANWLILPDNDQDLFTGVLDYLKKAPT